MKRILRTGLAIALLLILLFAIYSIVPRVRYIETSYGQSLKKSDVLPPNFQDELRGFVRDTASRMQSAMILHEGNIIFEEGDTKKLINCHSARKSILSLLFGIAQDKGLLRLDETLAELGIDESKTPLTPQEKTATIRDLLMCKSGIFLAAEAEHDWAKNRRAQRGKYQAGEFFFYNNFDFNILGVILEQKTKMSIGEFMETYLAKPLGMQEFRAANVVYNSPWPVPRKTDSDHPVYWIYMSARDFAKIGVLINNKGKWGNKQVVSSNWLTESIHTQTLFSEEVANFYQPYDAFAYSWWLEKDTKTIWADGYGGQFLCIDSTNNLVVLQRNFTGNSLLSSGLFLRDKNRDNNPKSDLLHLYQRTLQQIVKAGL